MKPEAIKKNYRYPGIAPFKTQESNIFFGRKQDTEELYSLLKEERLVVLYGKSGLGKSSLLNAGIIPKCIEAGVYSPVVIRFGAWTENSTLEPLDILKSTLKNTDFDATILDKLIPGDNSLWFIAKKRQLSNGEKTMVLFDQFEELFSYPENQVNKFQQELSELLHTGIPLRFRRALDNVNNNLLDEEESKLEAPLDTRLLFAIRSDRMHLLDRLTSYLPTVLRNCFELKAFEKEDARLAIVLPAEAEGDFATDTFKYSIGAIETLLNFLKNEEDGRIEGILLQMLCENYERKHVELLKKQILDVDDIGSPSEVIKNYYEEKLEELPTEERTPTRLLIEEGLVSEGDFMRLSLHEAYILQEFKVNRILLEKLVDNRLLRSEPFLRGGYTYELCHDILVDAVLQAKKKRLEEEEALMREQEYQQKLREEEEKRKIEEDKRMLELERKGRIKAKRLSFLGFALAGVAILLAAYANNLRNEARLAVRESEYARQQERLQKEIAQKYKNISDSLSNEALSKLKLIELSYKEIKRQQAIVEKEKETALNALKEARVQRNISNEARAELEKAFQKVMQQKEETAKALFEARKEKLRAERALEMLKLQLEENKKLQEKNQKYEDLIKILNPNRYRQIE